MDGEGFMMFCRLVIGTRKFIEERRSGAYIDPSSRPWIKRKSASLRREERVGMFSFKSTDE